MLEDDLGRDKITPHIFRDGLLEESGVSHGLQNFDLEDTSVEATRALFRWVLDNGEGMPLEEAYKDPWLLNIGDEDSESDGMSSYPRISVGVEPEENEGSANSSGELAAWIDQASPAIEQKDSEHGMGLFQSC